MKKIGFVVLLLSFFVLLVACATTSIPTGKEVPGVVAESPQVLVLGSKFVFQETNKEKKEYERKRAYWVDTTGGKAENFNVYDMNLNWMAFIRKGEEQTSASPCLKEFSWPLKVGKGWQTSYDY